MSTTVYRTSQSCQLPTCQHPPLLALLVEKYPSSTQNTTYLSVASMSASADYRPLPSAAYPYSPFALRSSRVSANKIIPRIVVFGATLITVCGFLYLLSGPHGATVRTTLGKYGYHRASKERTIFAQLYDPIRHPVGAKVYTDAYDNEFRVQDSGPYWKEPLGQSVLIVDIDTRVPQGPNELWNNGSINWETLNEHNGGMITASQMNHFLYGMRRVTRG
jgi:hypothetical protein